MSGPFFSFSQLSVQQHIDFLSGPALQKRVQERVDGKHRMTVNLEKTVGTGIFEPKNAQVHSYILKP